VSDVSVDVSDVLEVLLTGHDSLAQDNSVLSGGLHKDVLGGKIKV
jgi:hypothetical protein